jgi:hypothetical protein
VVGMGEYKVWVDKNGIIRGQIIGSHDEDDAVHIIKEIDDILLKMEQKGVILIDMSKTGRPTTGSRKVHAENIKHGYSKFKKAAFFGASAFNRVMANFIIKASGKGEVVRYFDKENDAINWLLD